METNGGNSEHMPELHRDVDRGTYGPLCQLLPDFFDAEQLRRSPDWRAVATSLRRPVDGGAQPEQPWDLACFRRTRRS